MSNFRKWHLGGHLQKCDKGQVMHPVPIATQYTNLWHSALNLRAKLLEV